MILRDARSLTEQEAAWYLYMKTHLKFPFIATYQKTCAVKPFCTGAKVQVIGLAQPEQCKEIIQARVMDGQGSVFIPLTHLSPSDAGQNADAISDWRYWHDRKTDWPSIA